LPRSSALVLARTYGICYSERISLSTAARTCTLFRTALALFLLQKRQLRLVTLVFLFQPPSIREIILRHNVFRQFFCRNRNITLGQPPKSALWRQISWPSPASEEKSLAPGTGGSRWPVLLRENRIYNEIQNALKAECGVPDSLPALSRYDQRHNLEFMAGFSKNLGLLDWKEPPWNPCVTDGSIEIGRLFRKP